MLYLTDRAPVERKDGTLRYGYERSQSLAFGSCIVEIGKDLTWEVLVENSRRRERSVALPLTVQTITEHARLPATPIPFIQDGSSYKDDPATVARAVKIAEIFRRELQERLALTARKEAYIFIHGYNNTFEDAVFVIAELWHFMGRGGVPIAYTWPAGHPGLGEPQYRVVDIAGQHWITFEMDSSVMEHDGPFAEFPDHASVVRGQHDGAARLAQLP